MGDLKAPTMDWSKPDRVATYKLFKQKAQMYFEAKDIKKGKQVSHILLMTGDEGFRMFNSWGLSTDDAKDPEKVWVKFDEQIEPRSSFRVERLTFQRMRQEENETSDDFISRLKNQATLCKFSNNDERIIDQIIYGTRFPEVQKTLLVKKEDFPLEEAITVSRIYDASTAHQRAFKEIQESETLCSQVDSVQYKQSKYCPTCGEFQHRSNQVCPALGTLCGICKELDHWAKVCPNKSKPQTWESNNGNSRHFRGRRGRSRGRGQGRYRSRNRGRYYYDAERSDNSQQQEYKRVDAIFPEDDDNFTHIAYHAINITVDTVKQDQDSAYATLDIELPGRCVTDTLRLKVDTGAGGNILPLRIYRQMFPGKLDTYGYPRSTEVINKPEVKLSAYNGSIIKQHGALIMKCRYRESGWQKLTFYIAESDGPAILGLPSCKMMNIVSLYCDGIGVEISSKLSENTTIPKISDIEDLKKAFPESFDTLGNFPGEYHITVDPNVAPVVHAARKYAIQRRDAMKNEIEKMESLGVITKETEPTDWVSSLTFVEKPGGGVRVCLDPKDLNRAIKRPHHKTPTLEEITHHFSGSAVFSKMDAKNGYWSIRLDEPSSKLTTFHTPFGRYRFLRLPFGLVVSQDVFQQRMDAILEKCPGCTGIADDVAVYGKDEKEHDANLLNLMKVAREHGLVFNSSKCVIKTTEIPFFGMIYSADGVRPDPDRVAAINQLPAPTTVKELQEFLGIATYMAPFIPRLSHHAAVLRQLLKKNTVFSWLDSHEAAFQNIKELICRDTTLAYFDPDKESVLQVDSSMRGLGAVLMQEGKPIAFASKSLTDAETRYANIERELLSAVYGCERFHTYLYGKPFVIHSDHKPLEMIQLKNLHAAPPRLQRMLLRLQNYNVTIQYKPGRSLLLADGLSRLHSATDCAPIELDVCVNLVHFSQEKVIRLREETARDPVLSKLKEVILNGWPEWQKQVPKTLKPYWSYRDELSVEDGVILKGSEQVIIPKSMQQFILESLHAGHQGREKCRLRAKHSVYWNNMYKDLEEFVGSCPICQEHARSQLREPLLQKDIPPRPWHTLSADLFSLEGEEYLLIVDHYAKYPFVKKMGKYCSSKACIDYFKDIFGIQGLCEILYTDNGPQFSGHLFTNFAKEWAFQHITSSPRFPQSNGFIERAVQTVKNTLKKAKEDNTDPNMALLCLRTTPVSDQIKSPIELLMGRKAKANLPVCIRNQHADRDQINDALENRQWTQKHYYDQRAGTELPMLPAGQAVHVQNHTDGRWLPGVVEHQCTEPRSYVVSMDDGRQLRRNRRQIHMNGGCSKYGRVYKTVNKFNS